MTSQSATFAVPSLIRLGACLVYELLTLLAIMFVSAATFLWLFGDASHGLKRFVLQFFLWGVVGAYFVWCWVKTGQTLAMQAWKIQLRGRHNQLPDIKLAMLRYVLASLSLTLFAVGFLWAIVDRQHLFLHDRIVRCRLYLLST